MKLLQKEDSKTLTEVLRYIGHLLTIILFFAILLLGIFYIVRFTFGVPTLTVGKFSLNLTIKLKDILGFIGSLLTVVVAIKALSIYERTARAQEITNFMGIRNSIYSINKVLQEMTYELAKYRIKRQTEDKPNEEDAQSLKDRMINFWVPTILDKLNYFDQICSVYYMSSLEMQNYFNLVHKNEIVDFLNRSDFQKILNKKYKGYFEVTPIDLDKKFKMLTRYIREQKIIIIQKEDTYKIQKEDSYV